MMTNLFFPFLSFSRSSEPPDTPGDLKVDQISSKSAKISWSPPFSGNSRVTKYQLFLEEFATLSIGHYSSPTTDSLMTLGRDSGGSNTFFQIQSQTTSSGLHNNNNVTMMMVGSSKGRPEIVPSSLSSPSSASLGDGVVYGGGGKRNLTISPSETTWIIPDLFPFTNYSVRVSAVNSLGMSETSAPLLFVTEEEGK